MFQVLKFWVIPYLFFSDLFLVNTFSWEKPWETLGGYFLDVLQLQFMNVQAQQD